jgi:hypothetical protein
MWVEILFAAQHISGDTGKKNLKTPCKSILYMTILLFEPTVTKEREI